MKQAACSMKPRHPKHKRGWIVYKIRINTLLPPVFDDTGDFYITFFCVYANIFVLLRRNEKKLLYIHHFIPALFGIDVAQSVQRFGVAIP